MTRFKIILNPNAGRGEGARMRPQIEACLQAHTLDYEVVQTERPWHAVELTQQAAAEGFDVVVAAGGDGTANEVLNGLMRAKAAGHTAAMGVLPVGQGNDFAFGMGIPHDDLALACSVLSEPQHRTIDVGRISGGLHPEGRYFGNGIGVGFDAVVGFEALKLTRLHGFPAYLVAALKTIFLYFNAPTVQLELNDEQFTLPALLVSVMNGRRMGGGFMMAPEGDPQDGRFNLCIAKEVSKLDMFRLVPRFLAGTQGEHPAVSFRDAARVQITALEGVLPTHADGETVSTEGKNLLIELLPASITILTPQ